MRQALFMQLFETACQIYHLCFCGILRFILIHQVNNLLISRDGTKRIRHDVVSPSMHCNCCGLWLSASAFSQCEKRTKISCRAAIRSRDGNLSTFLKIRDKLTGRAFWFRSLADDKRGFHLWWLTTHTPELITGSELITQNFPAKT